MGQSCGEAMGHVRGLASSTTGRCYRYSQHCVVPARNCVHDVSPLRESDAMCESV
jgi:hypothetical protein